MYVPRSRHSTLYRYSTPTTTPLTHHRRLQHSTLSTHHLLHNNTNRHSTNTTLYLTTNTTTNPLNRKLSTRGEAITSPPKGITKTTKRPNRQRPPPTNQRKPLYPRPYHTSPRTISSIRPTIILRPLRKTFLQTRLLTNAATRRPSTLPFRHPTRYNERKLR